MYGFLFNNTEKIITISTDVTDLASVLSHSQDKYEAHGLALALAGHEAKVLSTVYYHDDTETHYLLEVISGTLEGHALRLPSRLIRRIE